MMGKLVCPLVRQPQMDRISDRAYQSCGQLLLQLPVWRLDAEGVQLLAELVSCAWDCSSGFSCARKVLRSTCKHFIDAFLSVTFEADYKFKPLSINS